MRSGVGFVVFLLLSQVVWAGSTYSFRERKKLFDQRASIVFEIREVFSLSEEPGKNTLTEVKSLVEEAYRDGERANLEKTLTLAEGELVFASRKLSQKMDQISEDSLKESQIILAEMNAELKTKNPKVTPEKRDKVAQYLFLAKSEREQALASFASGNFSMSLLHYKRAVTFSLFPFQTYGKEYGKDYQTAASIWVAPLWDKSQKSKKNSYNQN